MDPKFTDAKQTLSFGRAKLARRMLFIGLLSLAAGIFLLWLNDNRQTLFMGYLGLGLGLLICGYEFHRFFNPAKPLLVLSPEGVRIRIELVKQYLIPWGEVREVGSTDIEGTFRGQRIKFDNVTYVGVTRSFYERVIFVDNWFLRGPGWDTNYIPAGGLVRVALHHEILPATAEELRTAVETRWKAFGKTAPVPAA